MIIHGGNGSETRWAVCVTNSKYPHSNRPNGEQSMKALILAAGDGTRMRPLTAYTPKPLLKVAGRPFLSHCLTALKKGGIDEVVIVVGWRQEKVRSALGDGSSLGMKVTYVEQTRRLGTANAVGTARDNIDDDFLCLNGDIILTDDTVRSMIAKFKEHQGAVMSLSRVKDPRGYGVVVMDGEKIVDIKEKPIIPPSDLVNAGVYAFPKNVFDAIDRTSPSARGEYEITDTLMILAKEHGVFGFVMEEPWLDVGRPWELLDANEYLMEKTAGRIDGEVENGVVLQGEVVVEKGARVRTGSYILGPVHIGEGTDVGPHSYIRGKTSIGSGCRVGAFVEIKNSVIMDRSNVPHHNYVGDSIIGSGCNLGSGTKVANLRLDNRNVTTFVKGMPMDSGRRKLGIIMGDNVKTGINSVLNVGTVIGEDSFIGPGAQASGCIAPGSRIF